LGVLLLLSRVVDDDGGEGCCSRESTPPMTLELAGREPEGVQRATKFRAEGSAVGLGNIGRVGEEVLDEGRGGGRAAGERRLA
jgi:hypothetical protein